MDFKILQIVPAQPGWYARFADCDADDDAVSIAPVVCWALAETEEGQAVEGLVPTDFMPGNGVSPVSDVSRISELVFVGYTQQPPEGAKLL